MRKYFLYLILPAILIFPFISATGADQELSEADKKFRDSLGDGAMTFQLWPDSPPDENEEIGPEILKPSVKENRGMRVTEVERPTMTVRRPEGAGSETPAVLISPGGAYNSLAIEEEGIEIVKWLNSLGITGILLKYRVPRRGDDFPKHHHALQDAQRAMGLIRHYAEPLGIDPDQVGVLGFSAGGHLSAVLSSNYGERLYEPVDEADEEIFRPNFTVLVYPAYLSEKSSTKSIEPFIVAEELSPRAAPPTFIAVSQMDGVKRDCIVYFRALTKAEVPSELHIYEKGEHGGGMRLYPFSEWGEASSRWMEDMGIIGRH